MRLGNSKGSLCGEYLCFRRLFQKVDGFVLQNRFLSRNNKLLIPSFFLWDGLLSCVNFPVGYMASVDLFQIRITGMPLQCFGWLRDQLSPSTWRMFINFGADLDAVSFDFWGEIVVVAAWVLERFWYSSAVVQESSFLNSRNFSNRFCFQQFASLLHVMCCLTFAVLIFFASLVEKTVKNIMLGQVQGKAQLLQSV